MFDPVSPLPADVLLGIADRRAHGLSWEATAQELHLDPDDIRRLTRSAGQAYRDLYRAARREVSEEASAEAIHFLRKDLRSKEKKDRQAAAECLLRLRMTELRHLAHRKPAAAGP